MCHHVRNNSWAYIERLSNKYASILSTAYQQNVVFVEKGHATEILNLYIVLLNKLKYKVQNPEKVQHT